MIIELTTEYQITGGMLLPGSRVRCHRGVGLGLVKRKLAKEVKASSGGKRTRKTTDTPKQEAEPVEKPEASENA